jgi:hypothetical protein
MLPDFLNFQYLKQAVPIEAVLQDRGLRAQLKKRRDHLFGPRLISIIIT